MLPHITSKLTLITYFLAVFNRTLANHGTYVFLVNFGAREEIIDVNTVFQGFSDHSEVVVAGADTDYRTG